MPPFPLGLILHEKDPSLSICTNSHALIADTQSVLSGAGGYLHDHLPLFFGVPSAGMKLHCFSVAPRKSQGVGEVKQGGFCDLLARRGPRLAIGILGCQKKPMGIAERAFAHDALERKVLVVRSIDEGGGSSPIADAAGRTEQAAISGKVLRSQGGVVVLGDITADGICLCVIGEQLAARVEAI